MKWSKRLQAALVDYVCALGGPNRATPNSRAISLLPCCGWCTNTSSHNLLPAGLGEREAHGRVVAQQREEPFAEVPHQLQEEWGRARQPSEDHAPRPAGWWGHHRRPWLKVGCPGVALHGHALQLPTLAPSRDGLQMCSAERRSGRHAGPPCLRHGIWQGLVQPPGSSSQMRISAPTAECPCFFSSPLLLSFPS